VIVHQVPCRFGEIATARPSPSIIKSSPSQPSSQRRQQQQQQQWPASKPIRQTAKFPRRRTRTHTHTHTHTLVAERTTSDRGVVTSKVASSASTHHAPALARAIPQQVLFFRSANARRSFLATFRRPRARSLARSPRLPRLGTRARFLGGSHPMTTAACSQLIARGSRQSRHR
jgi:hypothetical protein